jgi:hypothetical protein
MVDTILDNIRAAAHMSLIINRSGALTKYFTAEFTDDLKGIIPGGPLKWTKTQVTSLWNILEENDAILIVSAGNRTPNYDGSVSRQFVGFTDETSVFNTWMALDNRLMQRVLVVGNFRPLSRVRANKRKRLSDPDYVSLSGLGEIVSYAAGVVKNHFVLVAGVDIYTYGENGDWESNDGSSEAAPITSSLLNLFQEYRQFETYKEMLYMFKNGGYTRTIGDTYYFGLGVPDVQKMFDL